MFKTNSVALTCATGITRVRVDGDELVFDDLDIKKEDLLHSMGRPSQCMDLIDFWHEAERTNVYIAVSEGLDLRPSARGTGPYVDRVPHNIRTVLLAYFQNEDEVCFQISQLDHVSKKFLIRIGEFFDTPRIWSCILSEQGDNFGADEIVEMAMDKLKHIPILIGRVALSKNLGVNFGYNRRFKLIMHGTDRQKYDFLREFEAAGDNKNREIIMSMGSGNTESRTALRRALDLQYEVFFFEHIDDYVDRVIDTLDKKFIARIILSADSKKKDRLHGWITPEQVERMRSAYNAL